VTVSSLGGQRVGEIRQIHNVVRDLEFSKLNQRSSANISGGKWFDFQSPQSPITHLPNLFVGCAAKSARLIFNYQPTNLPSYQLSSLVS
jgi:hypothetical protein